MIVKEKRESGVKLNSCLNLIKENNLVVEMKRGNYKVLIKDRIKNKGKYTSFWYDRKYNHMEQTIKKYYGAKLTKPKERKIN